MKIKLQFLGIIFLLGLAVNQLDKNQVPNQQIIIEFSDSDFHNETEILASLKSDLKNLGVSNLSIKKQNSSQLLLTYFSNVEIKKLQKVIQASVNNEIFISSKKPFEPHSEHQKVKFKILYLDKDGLPINGFTGTATVETSFKANRLDTKLNDFNFSGLINLNTYFLKKKRHQNNNSKDLCFNFLLNFNLPEVRAGPYLVNG